MIKYIVQQQKKNQINKQQHKQKQTGVYVAHLVD